MISFIAYLPVFKCQFTNWDDPVYVLENSQVKQLSAGNIYYFFTRSSASNYHPLTMISLSADYFISSKISGGLKPDHEIKAVIFHFVNLFFHLLNTILVFLFIYNLTGKNPVISFITALLFGIHPMHVESVAWIAERKDVLYAFFLLAGLNYYLKFIKYNSNKFYIFSLLFFILSLLSKPAAVIFPLLLFCIDYYLNRPFNYKLFFQKIPFLALSVIFGITTLVIQSHDAIASFSTLTIAQRFFCVSYGMVMYLVKFLLPVNLSAFYPFPQLTPAGFLPVFYYLAPILLIAIVGAVAWSRKSTRVVVFGFLVFFFSICLVLQVISVGKALMADRYTYIPFIGLFFIAGYYADAWWKRIRRPMVKFGSGGILLLYVAFLALATSARAGTWQNSETLWTDVLATYPACDIALNNRGNYYFKQNLFEQSKRDYEAAIAFGYKEAMVFRNVGNVYVKLDMVEPAIKSYTRALEQDVRKKDSNAYLCYLNRGNLLAKTKNFQGALADYANALEIYPGSKMILVNRAYAYTDMNDFANGITEYSKVIQTDSLTDDLFLKRGFCYFNLNRFPEAMKDFKRCILLNPAHGLALYNCSVISYKTGDLKMALEYANKARAAGFDVNPGYLEILNKSTKGSL
ncbi:MAG: tetratricopeptide repeat protein [Bacteroidota bacterium]